jgi:hypothetical protein
MDNPKKAKKIVQKLLPKEHFFAFKLLQGDDKQYEMTEISRIID